MRPAPDVGAAARAVTRIGLIIAWRITPGSPAASDRPLRSARRRMRLFGQATQPRTPISSRVLGPSLGKSMVGPRLSGRSVHPSTTIDRPYPSGPESRAGPGRLGRPRPNSDTGGEFARVD